MTLKNRDHSFTSWEVALIAALAALACFLAPGSAAGAEPFYVRGPDAGYIGRSLDGVQCGQGLNCRICGSRWCVDSDGGTGGSGVSFAGLCGIDGGSALGFDGGALVCVNTVKAGSCAAGRYVTAISTTAAPTCSDETADGGEREPWHSIGETGEPAFQSSWVNYDTATYGYASFRMEPGGRVYLRGLVKNGTISASCTDYLFTLPGGYRPPYQYNYSVTSNAGVAASVAVKADGNVCINSGNNGWVTLSGISWSVQ